MWITAATHTGQKRAANQDVYRTGQLPGGNAYLLVCDGMGGERGGDVASFTAADIVGSRIERDVSRDIGEISVRRVLESAGAAANAAVYARSSTEPELAHMGTTLSAVVITGSTAHILHAGDSRVYLLREGLLHRITTDHTVVQMLIERGDLTEQAAATHPQRHYITRAVGTEKQLIFDVFTIDVQPGDTLLVCSDGLYNELSDGRIAEILTECIGKRSAQPLIDAANLSGGSDNITAAICRIDGEEDAHG